MNGLSGVDRFFPSVVDLSPILDLARSRGYYGLDAGVGSAELMEVGGAVDHLLALSRPAFVSPPAKKRFPGLADRSLPRVS
jgi:hypothetical protein